MPLARALTAQVDEPPPPGQTDRPTAPAGGRGTDLPFDAGHTTSVRSACADKGDSMAELYAIRRRIDDESRPICFRSGRSTTRLRAARALKLPAASANRRTSLRPRPERHGVG